MRTFVEFIKEKDANFFENKGVDFSDPKVAAGLDKQDKERTANFVAFNANSRKKLLDSIGKEKKKPKKK